MLQTLRGTATIIEEIWTELKNTHNITLWWTRVTYSQYAQSADLEKNAKLDHGNKYNLTYSKDSSFKILYISLSNNKRNM